MSVDYDARQVTLNYTGGSLSMALGNAKNLFGDDFDQITGAGVETTVSVAGHQRIRVIGGPSTTVSAHTYTYTQWPTSEAGGARGGEPVMLDWEGSDGEWTGRVSGSMAALGTFLNTNTGKVVVFRTQSGTKYGPFNKADTP